MPFFKRKAENPPKTISSFIWGNDIPVSQAKVPNGTVCDSSSASPVPSEELLITHLSDVEDNFKSGSPMRTNSRLSKTLQEVLNDHGALAYFIQFMEAQNVKHYVKFWLEAESFHLSARTRLKDKLEKCALSDATVCFKLSNNRNSNSEESEVFHENNSDGKKLNLENSYKESINNVHLKVTTKIPDYKLKSYNSESEKTVQILSEQTVYPETNQCIEENLHRPSLNVNKENKFSCDVYESKVNENNPVNNVNNVPLVNDTILSADKKEILHESVEQHLDNLIIQKDIDPNLKDIENPVCAKNDVTKQDAIHIYSKYIAQNAPHPITLSADLRNQVIENIFREDEIDPNCFIPIQKFVIQKMDAEYFPAFLRSTFHCKHQIDVLTSGSVYLADILYNDVALFYFMEYTEQEGVQHMVDFLLMADHFRNQFLVKEEKIDGMQAQDDAMVLYDKYFSLQATSSLGFSDKIRCEIEQNICQSEGPSPDCFLKPVTILMQHLEKSYLHQFLTSQLYYKYLSECINTIQNGCDLFSPRKRSGSESSSEHSFHTQQQTINTLLAMDSKQPGGIARKILKNIEEQDMRIDTGQFHPDALWKRQLAGKLQMAHVDKFGKLTTEFQPEPDRKTGSRLSKAVKKLVNWEEDKTQEDMAWQIAEMIVKDICDITMKQNKHIKSNESSGVS